MTSSELVEREPARNIITDRGDPESVMSAAQYICGNKMQCEYTEVIGVQWTENAPICWIKVWVEVGGMVSCAVADVYSEDTYGPRWRTVHHIPPRYMQTVIEEEPTAEDFQQDVMALLRMASLLLTDHRMIRDVDRSALALSPNHGPRVR